VTDRQSVTVSEICVIGKVWYNGHALESMGLQDTRKGSRLRGSLVIKKRRRTYRTVPSPAQQEIVPLMERNDRRQAFDRFVLPMQA
jgi:hypothetical protein